MCSKFLQRKDVLDQLFPGDGHREVVYLRVELEVDEDAAYTCGSWWRCRPRSSQCRTSPGVVWAGGVGAWCLIWREEVIFQPRDHRCALQPWQLSIYPSAHSWQLRRHLPNPFRELPCIAHFIKPYRDQVHFVNWISVNYSVILANIKACGFTSLPVTRKSGLKSCLYVPVRI